MGVVSITVVTLLDRRGDLPRSSGDASPTLWNFLIRQCRVLASEPLGAPMVLRSADLRRLAGPLMDLPRPQRPVVRTRRRGTCPGAGDLFAEDGPGESVEWPDAVAGLRALADPRLIHLWVVGAADLCAPLLEGLRSGARLVAIQVGGLWGEGRGWQLGAHVAPGTSTWTPTPPPTEGPLAEALRGCAYRYAIIPSAEARAADERRAAAAIRAAGRDGRGPLARLLAAVWPRRHQEAAAPQTAVDEERPAAPSHIPSGATLGAVGPTAMPDGRRALPRLCYPISEFP
ncbi:virion protein US2 [Ateline alphaherpesvirus 1]|uniref:Virion protein US2 n=1 Tax=Herpesvirus ateles type 1 (strain Lennette) TaxID=35243 RepID=A0A1S6JLR1_HSVA1|nr:virion protein US2 [Ateline alphaherpesvirus 1]AQS79219.1 virion protein US2 [Ateline alphaherpesvirus 1]